jgi:uncharacterized membrane protein
MSETDQREQAVRRLKAKRHFWQFVAIWVVVSVVLTVIWLLSGAGGYFWPVWPIAGMGIAALFIGIDSYGPGNRTITDSDIDREISKMNGRKSDPT